MPTAEARWTDAELLEAIAGYRQVLARENVGQAARTAELHRELSEASSGGRSIGSFGRRMSNISAVLVDAGILPANAYPPTLGNVGSGVRVRILNLWNSGADLTPTADPVVLAKRVLTAKATLKTKPVGQPAPAAATRTVAAFVRDPKVVAWVLKLAQGFCESCDEHAPFERDDGEPFLEVHHVRTLAEGGGDVVENCVALCPNCHRGLHYAADRQTRRASLYLKIGRLITSPPAP
ncbi:HNH endonuclease [Brevundimonas sp.]|jgi:5-methylcytosine-specific restriction protein A|uniref:HNH endonuclease n=1 Tax=Brevundimonas sp. TaxID=1871086 RepID=UPI003D136100